jgi:hypothetical protein
LTGSRFFSGNPRKRLNPAANPLVIRSRTLGQVNLQAQATRLGGQPLSALNHKRTFRRVALTRKQTLVAIDRMSMP